MALEELEKRLGRYLDKAEEDARDGITLRAIKDALERQMNWNVEHEERDEQREKDMRQEVRELRETKVAFQALIETVDDRLSKVEEWQRAETERQQERLSRAVVDATGAHKTEIEEARRRRWDVLKLVIASVLSVVGTLTAAYLLTKGH